uniref:Uncharacterized protein n=1 Tax=Dermatophagoides pteronyssinus TaxID=6956 RepID=A0A6P6Y6E2_DERPT|nr:putative uncharacterized protein DDB_G0288537 [Dermatophagoides pteronyssinus]
MIVIKMKFQQIFLSSILFINLFQHYMSYPMPQMRICIKSIDPQRLPSQCIYCKSRTFPITVRMCTGNSYLPARMTLNEASCLITTCRKQLPRYPPEPYSYLPRPMANNHNQFNKPNNNHNNDESNNDDNNNNNDEDDNDNGNGNDQTNHDDNGNNGGNMIGYHRPPFLNNNGNGKIRKPAKFFLGKPQKIQTSIRPFSLYG